MILFEEPFSDPTKLARDWVIGPGMAIRNGVLAFSPGHDEGYCVGTTRRTDFRDFSLAADVKIVCAAVGLVLRAVGPTQYYMVQFDLANNPNVVWFHTFTPDVEEGYRLEMVPSVVVPRTGAWHRMRVVVRGAGFDVYLGEPEGTLQHCASWLDSHETYRQGAVGVWEHGGESGEYRGLRVDTLDEGAV
jgi:hypothetical protein